MTRITFASTVARLYKHERTLRAYKNAAGDVVHDVEDLGWFVLLSGSHEAIHVGNNKPDIQVGDRADVSITFRRK